MQKTKYKLIGANLSPDFVKMYIKILETNKEKPIEFFKRIIQSEYDKSMGVEALGSPERIEAIELKLSSILKKVDSINETTKTQHRNFQLLYGAISYCVKIVFGTRYFLALLIQQIPEQILKEKEKNAKAFDNDVIIKTNQKSKEHTNISFNKYLDKISINNLESMIDFLREI